MRRTIVAACALGMFGVAATVPRPAGALEFPAPVRPLTAAQFRAIGVAAGAEPLAATESAASALGVEQSFVANYSNALCNGTAPLLGPKPFPYPRDVFAYAAIFDAVDANCFTTERTLAAERGKVARSMARNQLTLDNLLRPKTSKVDKLCESFQKSEKLTAPAIALLAAKLFKLRDNGQKATEIGVSLLIGNCQHVFG